uniref:Uncharacterized protein n=1 Tax=Rhizophora mucronata TaxID=61149 RepID=A0A2P2JT41_RHIMU
MYHLLVKKKEEIESSHKFRQSSCLGVILGKKKKYTQCWLYFTKLLLIHQRS